MGYLGLSYFFSITDNIVLIILVHKHFYWSFRKLSSISSKLLIDKPTYENHLQLISNIVEISRV